ncbi:hypothetical protein MMC21_007737 [Puttea exsequens]|nr:hypothetical protein [Puttea exsequens]
MKLLISSALICSVSILLYCSLSTFTLTSLLQQKTIQLTDFLTAARIITTDLLSLRASSNKPSTTFFGLPFIPPTSFAPTKPANMTVPRAIARAFLATEQSEGAGARVRRSIGTPQLRNLSPFLMLDHASVSPGAGFPDHPHRGQETITYMLHGAIDHEDFAGNAGTIETGDLQFMTAGRGIMHAEMPRPNADGSPNVGIQLWVDLPQKLKSVEPRYRDLRAKEIPTITVDDGKATIKIISGQSHGIDSVQELAYTPVWIFDITLRPGGRVAQPLPAGWNSFAYTLAGSTAFGFEKDQTTVGKYHNVVFEQQGDVVNAEAAKDAEVGEDSRFLLVAGLPLDQKIVQYGPFVVNSQEEVYQAMMDYQSHANGFERAKGWRSGIGRSLVN